MTTPLPIVRMSNGSKYAVEDELSEHTSDQDNNNESNDDHDHEDEDDDDARSEYTEQTADGQLLENMLAEEQAMEDYDDDDEYNDDDDQDDDEYHNDNNGNDNNHRQGKNISKSKTSNNNTTTTNKTPCCCTRCAIWCCQCDTVLHPHPATSSKCCDRCSWTLMQIGFGPVRLLMWPILIPLLLRIFADEKACPYKPGCPYNQNQNLNKNLNQQHTFGSTNTTQGTSNRTQSPLSCDNNGGHFNTTTTCVLFNLSEAYSEGWGGGEYFLWSNLMILGYPYNCTMGPTETRVVSPLFDGQTPPRVDPVAEMIKRREEKLAKRKKGYGEVKKRSSYRERRERRRMEEEEYGMDVKEEEEKEDVREEEEEEDVWEEEAAWEEDGDAVEEDDASKEEDAWQIWKEEEQQHQEQRQRQLSHDVSPVVSTRTKIYNVTTISDLNETTNLSTTTITTVTANTTVAIGWHALWFNNQGEIPEVDRNDQPIDISDHEDFLSRLNFRVASDFQRHWGYGKEFAGTLALFYS